jgi:hypothetical protein
LASVVFAAVLAVVFAVALAVVFAVALAVVFVVVFVVVFIIAAVFAVAFITAAAFATIAVVNPFVTSFLSETASLCGRVFAPCTALCCQGNFSLITGKVIRDE